MTLVLKGGQDKRAGRAEGQTFMEVDCGGFKSFGLDAEVVFPEDFLLPIVNGEKVRGSFKTIVEDWNDIVVDIDIDPFQIKGLPGFEFSLETVTFDFSDKRNSQNSVFPPEYDSKYLLGQENVNLWRGVYAKNVSVTLPKSFHTNTNQRVTLQAEDLIIDDYGVSCAFTAHDILPFDKGSAGGWKFSVDKFKFGLEANRLIEAGFEGKIGLPFKGCTTALGYVGNISANNEYLLAVNTTVFQELCDSFLIKRNSNYSSFTRTGSQSGKQKSIKGTPDSFFLLPNGKYIFVEYSTNTSEGVKKLEDDIRKCLNPAKTKVPIDKIAEIILCVNFRLNADETQSLKDLLLNTPIQLTIYTLDSLALELHLNYRNLVKNYLGLPFDTGQIISIEEFVEEYNRASNRIATPLDNKFLHREKELQEFNDAVSESDFVILTGPAGVGKSRLALEGIKCFLSNNPSYTAYCISYKNHTLLEDLYVYFNPAKDYVLFVDDANRIDEFEQIIGFYKSFSKGNLKVVITVRNYALNYVDIHCQYYEPYILELTNMFDEEIVSIIEAKPFEILNQDFQRRIVEIADGNPRFAIMTASLAIKHQSISALQNVSGLFESYFLTFVKDNGEFNDPINMKSLGLISFFYAIPLRREVTSSILDVFNIKYSEFIESIDKLEKLELVEIQFDYVRIPEQNLATYFFYKVFVKDKLLPFELLLNNFFSENSSYFKECVISANNTFGYENVMEVLKPSLKNYLENIKENEESIKFLSIFWFYLREETLCLIFKIVESLPIKNSPRFELSKDSSSLHKDKVIGLLSGFFILIEHLKEIITLGFEYVRRKPEILNEWLQVIKDNLSFDKEDAQYGFARQFALFDVLFEGLRQDDKLLSIAFYELSKTFLYFKFHHAKGFRHTSFYWYDYPLPNNKYIQDFRKDIWAAVDEHFEKHRDEAFGLLENYSFVSPDVNKEIMEFDMNFVINVIKNHLNVECFEHCKYVQAQIRWCERNSVYNSSFTLLAKEFTNPTYEMFLKIDWNRLRDKELIEYDNYEEYNKLKEAEVRKSFVFSTIEEVRCFYESFAYLRRFNNNDWHSSIILDLIIDENCSNNFEIGCLIVEEILDKHNEVNYSPVRFFKNNLATVERGKIIWEIVQKHTFPQKELWNLNFYYYIDDSLLSSDIVNSFLKLLQGMEEENTIEFQYLERLKKYRKDIFYSVLKIIVQKSEEEDVQLKVGIDIFNKYFNQLGDDLSLIKKAYIQQCKVVSYLDFEGNGLVNILKKDPAFLSEFISDTVKDDSFIMPYEYRNLGFIWEVNNVEKAVSDVFDGFMESGFCIRISEHFCNAFFKKIDAEYFNRARSFLLSYLKSNFTNIAKMNLIVDITRHSMQEMYEEVILSFLDLCQDVDIFSRISWRGNSTSIVGDGFHSDVEIGDWLKILSIVGKSNVGLKLLPIKSCISERIEECKKYRELEKQRRFLSPY